MVIPLLFLLAAGSGSCTDTAAVVRVVLTSPLDATPLSDELRDPTTSFRGIVTEATLGQSVSKVYKTQVHFSADHKLAIVHLAVHARIYFCVLALVDVASSRVLWLAANGEFPDGLVPGVHVRDETNRQGLLFVDTTRLLLVHFGGTIWRIDDLSALKSNRIEAVRRVVQWDKEADKSDVLRVGDVTIRPGQETQWEVFRNGRRLRIIEGGFVE